jgi:hypothetical protein
MTETDLKGELEEWGDVLNPGRRRKDDDTPNQNR